MTLRCIDPAVGDDLRCDVRPGGDPLGPEQVLHLEACESCRAAVEQLRRLAGTWTAMQPTPRELRAARTRFLGRSGKRRSARVVPKAAALVVVLAAAAASAAVRVAVTRLVTPAIPSAALPGEGPSLASVKRPHAVGHRATALDAGVSGVVIDPPLVEAPVAEPPVAEVPVDELPRAPAPPVGPGVAVPPEAPAISVAPPRHVAAAPPAVPAPEAVAAPSPWTVAAAAMRVSDYGAAEAAFDELAGAADAPTRDAARLARAQVWIAQGRSWRARPELESLAADGATPLLRKRAAAALDPLR
jgi:hypothetical protein